MTQASIFRAHFNRLTPQAVFAGVLAAFVGFASSFTIVVEGLRGAGANALEVSSGLMALSIAMGMCGIVVSLATKMPISIAWSTPGAVLLASSGTIIGGFPGAVSAFLICGVLLVVAGLWQPLGRLVANIPACLANAMLAGILLHLCLAPFLALKTHPLEALAILCTWALVAKIKRVLAVPAAVVVTALLITVTQPTLGATLPTQNLWPAPIFTWPMFTLQNTISIALPLFLVTMASQNIPGIAVLALYDYHPKAGAHFTVTGLFSLLSASFGGHAVNLAAITAALCAGPEAGENRDKRYWSAIIAGAVYIIFGLLAGFATAFIAASPPVLIEAVAGLALFGAFGSSLMGAVREEQHREAAVITFLISASGLSLLGIGAAFWGLVAGGVLMALERVRR